MFLGEGFGSGSGGWWGAVFLWKVREKGNGGGEGGGWSRDWQRNPQVNTQGLSKLPFHKLPLSFSPNKAQLEVMLFAHHTKGHANNTLLRRFLEGSLTASSS